jgi:opacity protein-like surface antigen
MAFMRATALLGAALVLGNVQGAMAADLGNYDGGSIKDGGYAPYQAPHRSFYVRVDGGYSWNKTPDITETMTCGSCTQTFDMINTSYDDTWTIGGGIGMNFTNRIRGDLTYDYRFDRDVSGEVVGSGHFGMDGVRDFGLKSHLFLANLYYDFDFGRRFTPYVGGGIGFASHKTGAGTVTDPCGCVIATIDEGSNTEFAAALMAGVSIKLWGGEQQIEGGGMKGVPMYVDSGRKVSLDIGYRYVWMGDAETGAVVRTVDGHQTADDPIVEDITAHELRVGLRYNLN